jgi:hypothetical protein
MRGLYAIVRRYRCRGKRGAEASIRKIIKLNHVAHPVGGILARATKVIAVRDSPRIQEAHGDFERIGFASGYAEPNVPQSHIERKAEIIALAHNGSKRNENEAIRVR